MNAAKSAHCSLVYARVIARTDGKSKNNHKRCTLLCASKLSSPNSYFHVGNFAFRARNTIITITALLRKGILDKTEFEKIDASVIRRIQIKLNIFEGPFSKALFFYEKV